jgi:hypothetical protein
LALDNHVVLFDEGQIGLNVLFKRRKDGLVYKMAVLATAHKLIRVMFSMLVNKRHFEPERRK